MTDKATENSQSPQPSGLGSTEGLGPTPTLVESLRAARDALRSHGATMHDAPRGQSLYGEAAAEIERMRDALLSVRNHCDPLPSALAAAIVATCDNGLGQPLTRVPPLGPNVGVKRAPGKK